MNLRDHSQVKVKKLIEYDEEEEERNMQSRSRRYWVKVDRRYFRQIDVQELEQIRQRIDNQMEVNQSLLPAGGFGNNNKISNQLSYFHRNIYSGNSKLFQRKAIRVLFQNSAQSQQQYGDSICIAYSFGYKYQQQGEDQQQFDNSYDEYYEYYAIEDDLNQNQERRCDKRGVKSKKNLRQVMMGQQRQIYNNSRRLSSLYDAYNEPTKHNSNNRIIPQQQQSPQPVMTSQLTVTYWKQPNPQTNPIIQEQIDRLTNVLQLTPNKSTSDINFLTQCNYYDLAKANLYPTQLDREISLWSYEFDKITTLNLQTWNIIQRNIQLQQQNQQCSNSVLITQNTLNQKESLEQQILNIHQFLAWQHNLVNFKNGFSDKNQQMLAEALQGMWIKQHKTKNMGDKKKFFKASIENLMQTKSELNNIFETDCKICFSTYVSQKNKVIYCDQCNESFHEKCYGIVDLNEDPHSKFYCDACQYLMQINKKNQQSPLCQICYVPFSPLKKFEHAFFHPSCLFMNNLLKSNLGELKLEENTTPSIIIKDVKQHEIYNENNQCEFCTQTCFKGLRFKCAQPSCSRYFHTICAYLHSNVFKIWRNKQKLQIEIRCWHHFPQRDNLRQTYLRRFFCNHKNIADLSQKEFIEIYNEEIESIRDYKLELKTSSTFIPYCDIENNKNCRENHDYNSLKSEKYQSNITKRKYKPRQKPIKKLTQVNNFIDLNSDDQQNTDYHNNSPQTLVHKNTTQQKQDLNQIEIQEQKKINHSQYLKHSLTKLQNDLMNKKKKTIQVKNSSQQLMGIQTFLSQIDNFGPQFNPFIQSSALNPYQINVSDSFQSNTIYQ